jgi:hypothetical protein
MQQDPQRIFSAMKTYVIISDALQNASQSEWLAYIKQCIIRRNNE